MGALGAGLAALIGARGDVDQREHRILASDPCPTMREGASTMSTLELTLHVAHRRALAATAAAHAPALRVA